MKISTKHYLIATSMAFMAMGCGNEHRLDSVSNRQLIDSMSLEEKAHIVMGAGKANAGGDAVVGATTGGILPGAASTSWPIERLGIPAVVFTDGPAGVRINSKRGGDNKRYYCTHFPIGTLLACTWNTDLVAQVGKAVGNEAREYGSDIQLAPAVNIMRNPLCGRNFEYYSEDPVVAGYIAAAYINGVQSEGVGTSIKHFAVNNQETNRQNVDARLSTRALREIYLKPFEIAIKKANPWTVMSSYNYINGQYASQSKELLTDILRNEWGFKGLVITDWFAGQDVVKQMAAGNDLLMPGRPAQYDSLLTTMRNGRMNMEDVDRNISRILDMIKQTHRFKEDTYSSSPDLKAHAAITRTSATEGMVLLKNQGAALPLSKAFKRVALFGTTSYRFIAGGTGSGNVDRAYTVSLLQGLGNAGYKADEKLARMYEAYIEEAVKHMKKPTGKFAHFLPVPLPAEKEFKASEIETYAADNDVAVITIGRVSGEFLDRSKEDFHLTEQEQNLISQVSQSFHAMGKKVIVLLNIGGVIETASWKDHADAILCAWQGGQEGGNSVVDILSGKVCPSGKLTMTFPIRYQDVPSANNFPSDGISTVFSINNSGSQKATKKNIDYANYEEDIFVGYRYYDSFDKAVSYPFGYGLSYTAFSYSNAKVSEKDGSYVVSVKISNVGKVAGKEVVQLYVADPQSKTLNKAIKELKGFAKTQELKPGESQIIEISVPADELSYFDEEASAWITHAGKYQFLVAGSSRDIKATLDATVRGIKKTVGRVLLPQHPMQLLHR